MGLIKKPLFTVDAVGNRQIFVNDKEIIFNEREMQMLANSQAMMNNTGYEVDITTLTAVIKSITEQKYYRVNPSEYMPIVVGEGAFNQELLKYAATFNAGSFKNSIIDTASANAKMSQASASVEPIKYKVLSYAIAIPYNVFELQQASLAGNWDYISSKEKARRLDIDLGIQESMFLGFDDDLEVYGILNLAGVSNNTVLITKYIKDMSAAEFKTFLAGLMPAYRLNCSYTAYPSNFYIPEQDYNGLATCADETYPMKSRLERIKEVLSQLSGQEATVKPLAYADAANNTLDADNSGLNRYVLTTYDPDSMRADIPVEPTTTAFNTMDGFSYQNVCYGQFSSVTSFRPNETLYFDFG